MGKSKKKAPVITLPVEESTIEKIPVDPFIEETLKGGQITLREEFVASVNWKFEESPTDGHKYLTYEVADEKAAILLTRMASMRNKAYDGFIREAILTYNAQKSQAKDTVSDELVLENAGPLESGFVVT